MKKLIFITVITLSGMLSACSASYEATSNQNQIQTSVLLSQNNYKVVGQVKGESKQCYVLGIGGLSNKSLKESAMSEMLNKANLQMQGNARAVINTNIQYKNQFYVLWGKKKVIANGTIIEFVK